MRRAAAGNHGGMAEPSYAGRLLVATPMLTDPNFARTVVLVLEHTETGCVGIVVNRPSPASVLDVLPAWEGVAAPPSVVFAGGPVSPTGAIGLALARPAPPPGPLTPSGAGLAVLGGAVATIDLDGGPSRLPPTVDRVRIFAGYAGWGAEQLATEITLGAWYVVAALPGDAFSPRPELLWRSVLRRQGGSLAMVSTCPLDPSLN